MIIAAMLVLCVPAFGQEEAPREATREAPAPRAESERPSPPRPAEDAPPRPERPAAPAERPERPVRDEAEREAPAERPPVREAPPSVDEREVERPDPPADRPADRERPEPDAPETEEAAPEAVDEPEVTDEVAETLREVTPTAPRRERAEAPVEEPAEVDAATVRREVRERRTEAISESIDRLSAEDVEELPAARRAALIAQVAQGARVELAGLREEAAEARLTLQHLYQLAARVRDDRQTIPRAVRTGQIPTLGAANRWEALQATNTELQKAIDRAFTERLRLLSEIPRAEGAFEQVASLRQTSTHLFDEEAQAVLEDAETYLQQRLLAMEELLRLYNEQAAVATDAYDDGSLYAEELSAAIVTARERGLLARTDEGISLETLEAIGASLAALPQIGSAIYRQYYEAGRPPATMLAFALRLAGSLLLLVVLVIVWAKLPPWLVAAFGGRGEEDADTGGGNGGDGEPDPEESPEHRRAELTVPVVRALLLAVLAALALQLWGLPQEWVMAVLAFLGAWAGYFALLAILRRLLAPRHEDLRVIPIDTGPAAALFRLLSGLALWSAIMLSGIWALTLLEYPHEDVLVLLSVIHVVGLAVIAGLMIYRVGGPGEFIGGAATGPAASIRRAATTAVPILLAVVAAVAILKAAGYVNLGGYIARIVYLNLPLVLAALILDWQIRTRLAADSPWRTWLRVAVWTALGIAQIPVLGLRWHHGQAVVELLQRPLFTVAESEVSIVSVSRAILVVFIAWLVAKGLQRWLATSDTLRSRLSEGVRYALSSLTFYLILIGGILWAMLVGGFPLNALTVLAGMAGIGLGFGLQEVVRNFVAGLILLIERPLAVGDYIEIAGTWGQVTAVSLRSTTVRTRDNVHILVPNGDILSEQLTNLSHHDLTTRIKVPVGVSYDSDVDQVLELLLQVAAEHENVADFPEPKALLQEFGDNSLDLELRAWVRDPEIHRRTCAELNLEIWRTLKREGIEIPFPQRDLHLRSVSAPLRIERADPEE